MYSWKNKDDKQIAKIILGNQGRLEKRRRHWENLWELVVKVFRPRRYDLLGGNTIGEQYGAKVYDQGPANALQKFTSGKLGYMVSRSVPWIQFIPTDSRLMQLDHVKRYLQDSATQVLYAAGRSNLYSALVPHALDADSVGTSVMIPMQDEVKDRLVFDVAHPRDSYIMVDQFGDPKVYHRKLKLTRMTALEKFGKDKLPLEWFRDGDLKEPIQEDEYIWCVYPNSDRFNNSLHNLDKPYLTLCILNASNREKSRLVYRRGREAFVIVYRTGRESGAEYGTSIAADCLTAGLVVNKLGEKAIEAAHKIVDPPVVASKSLRNWLETNAGSRTYVDNIKTEGVQTWMDRMAWPITDAQMERLHNQIEDRMFIRFFEMLSTQDVKTRTAYEVSQMMAEKATLMGTIIDTFEKESLEPCISTLIREEEEAGRMPDPPEELMMSGGRIDIRYLGPLSQLQHALLRGEGIVDSLDILERMMQLNQQVGWKFNWLEMAEEVAVSQGMPQKFVLSDVQVNQIRERAEAQEQALEQAAMMEAAGRAAPGLGKAPEEGSPAEMMMGA
jgi:hypothetical protein